MLRRRKTDKTTKKMRGKPLTSRQRRCAGDATPTTSRHSRRARLPSRDRRVMLRTCIFAVKWAPENREITAVKVSGINETALDEAADRHKETAQIFVCNFLWSRRFSCWIYIDFKRRDWVPFECDDKFNDNLSTSLRSVEHLITRSRILTSNLLLKQIL